MKSATTESFRRLLDAAPPAVQSKASAAYALWADNPGHPSLRFKKVHSQLPIYSVRIDRDWRALGVIRDDTIIWFWVGAHDDYEKMLSRL